MKRELSKKDLSAIGHRFYIARIKRGYKSARKLATGIGMSETTVYRLEQGKSDPSILTLANLCRFVNADINEVLYGEN